MAYVDAIHSSNKGIIRVVERDTQGNRVYVDHDAEYTFYYTHPSGNAARSIFDEPCRKYVTADNQKFRKEVRKFRAEEDKHGKPKYRIYESDANPIFRCLENHYKGIVAPTLNVGFFDIETGFNMDRGYAPVTDPFNPVTAITVHLSHVDRTVTLALKPPLMDIKEAQDICDSFDDTYLFDDERELLRTFLKIIEDVDCLSGWNSTYYDVPYLVNRVALLLGQDATRGFCLWGEKPRKREVMKYGKAHETYDLVGHTHLDYLELYQKHNPQQLHSYRLDYVGEIEVGDNKIVYEGTLDSLYNNDFRKFIDYNRQDVILLVKIDAKRKYIELANQIAHTNCVLLKTTMGTVALTEQAIMNDMHSNGIVAPDKTYQADEDEDEDEKTPVVGAYVADPIAGLHGFVGCMDINSLYPSVIRALNMSPETIVGQVRLDDTMALVESRIAAGIERASAWDGIFETLEVKAMHERSGKVVTVDFEDGSTKQMSGRELHAYIFNKKNNLCISANGTIFRTDKEGIIPGLLAKWYSERQAFQAKKSFFNDLLKGPVAIERLPSGLDQSMFTITETEVIPLEEKQTYYKGQTGYYDQLQQTRKILLNALYGALLNPVLRFYDERLGQSVTLTGRSIVRHMTAALNNVFTGEYDYLGKTMRYNDTDSVYFTAETILDMESMTRDEIVELYLAVADQTNSTFPPFMMETFNTSHERGSIIAAGLELVASKSLFIKKKKYGVLKFWDDDNKRLDLSGNVGKLKAMGLETKRADTPKFMQSFLERMLMDVLTGAQEKQIMEEIKHFRKEFKKRPGWEKGSPKKVAGLTKYYNILKRADDLSLLGQRSKDEKGKPNLPGHVRASINYNNLRQRNNDKYSMAITDGARIIVCKLLKNVLGMDSVAYPVDEMHLPDWFKELPFDDSAMENVIINKKMSNLIGVLDWDLAASEVRADNSEQFIVF